MPSAAFRWMPGRRPWLACLLLGGLLAAAPAARAAAENPCAGGRVARIQTVYQALQSFEAHFAQEDVQTDGRRVQAAGTVSYLKPGRMRWEYAPPNEQLLVTDGKTVWLYDPILDNVTVQALGELTQGTPLAFLLGVGNLEKDFACRGFTRPPPADGLDYVELVPRQPIPALAYIQLGAQPRTGRIASLRMVDAQGNLREVRFKDLRTDVHLSPQAFTFVVKPGMEVIRKSEG
jgi:outer membrane lipoprotein carrier protein